MGERKSLGAIVFDGAIITATTPGATDTIHLLGHAVTASDFATLLIISGGENFIDGLYMVESVDASMNTWTPNRTCSMGAGVSMTGRTLQKSVRRTPVEKKDRTREDHLRERYDPTLPSNPGNGEARRWALLALNGVEPRVLTSLAETCFHDDLLAPIDRDLLVYLEWGHFGEHGIEQLKPLEDAVNRWAKDQPGGRWNLCDRNGKPIDWIATAGVRTLASWKLNGQLPRRLRWQGFELCASRSIDDREASEILELERKLDASMGFVNFSAEQKAISRLSVRALREGKRTYKSYGKKLGLIPMPQFSWRYLEWYALRMFCNWKLARIREREFRIGRGLGIGREDDKDDWSAISHGIKVVADLVEFSR